MAAPQISGITALVKQYIRENQLSQSGITTTRSEPDDVHRCSHEGRRRQLLPCAAAGRRPCQHGGCHLCRFHFLVDGQDDGKVKAELGEDAAGMVSIPSASPSII